MKTRACLGLGLAVLMGCQPRRGEVRYGPVEAGLVLGYENPSLPPEARDQDRLQLRVDATSRVEGGLEVHTTLTTLRGQALQRLVLRRGGLAVWDGQNVLQVMLPEGFPGVTSWSNNGGESRVLGRSAIDPSIPLGPGADRVGIWVETQDSTHTGLRFRSCYVPEVGLVEMRVWRGGEWVPIKRLTNRTFADLPKPK